MKKPYMARYGARCMENGYSVIPLVPGEKRPALKDWRNASFDLADVQRWSGNGVGLRCGVGDHPLCAIDIDVTDEALAAYLRDWCLEELGDALIRVGRAPKILLLYRAETPGWSKINAGRFEDILGDVHGLEVLGDGQQFVAYGWHDGAGRDYEWLDLWGGPAECHASWLATVSGGDIQRLCAEWRRKAAELDMDPATSSPREGSGGTEVTAGRALCAGEEASARDPLANYQPPTGVSIEQARGLLDEGAGDPASYAGWLKAGMALHHEFAGGRAEADAFELWDQWSQRAPNYAGREDLEHRWEGFGRAVAAGARPATMRYMIKVAPRYGVTAPNGHGGDGGIPATPGQPPGFRPRAHPRTEIGNARRLVDTYGRELLYCAELSQWYRWTGVYWRAASAVELRSLAAATVDGILGEAEGMAEEDAERVRKWHAQSSRLNMLESMTKLAAAEPHLWVRVSELDAVRYLLGVRNGVVDLRTGRLEAPNPAHRVTRVAVCDWNGAAECPVWLATLRDIFRGDAEIIGFLQRLFGYMLLGEPVEDILVILFGLGNNGKSTLLNAIRYVTGMHSTTAAAATFLREGGGGGNTAGARPDILGMVGSRVVTVGEPEEGGELKEALVKSMTGGEALAARALYSNQIVQVQPTWTAVMATNHRPIVRGDDTGIWRRLMLIHFDRDFDRDPDVQKDPHREAKLRAEAPGILRWLVEGALEYQRQGLRVPGSVERARQEYRGEMDLLADWMAARCSTTAQARTPLDQLWVDWQAWAGARGDLRYISSSRALSRRLQARGFLREYTKVGAVYWGLKLKNSAITDC